MTVEVCVMSTGGHEVGSLGGDEVMKVRLS